MVDPEALDDPLAVGNREEAKLLVVSPQQEVGWEVGSWTVIQIGPEPV